MCGIAGYFTSQGAAEERLVKAMCDQMVHRGPDDFGAHVDGGCGIGMRRLSIIDLSTGHQPMSNEDGTVWVVFNGEVYNYQGLRENLIAQGHRFQTKSDTETLIHLYEQEGVEGLKKLRGMFAYAIWDGRRQRLLLVRDRFGKKPLYYAVLPQGIYFASELKCLRPHNLPLDLDEDAFRLYFRLSYMPDPHSPFRQVRKLEPGSWLTYDARGHVEKGTYWNMPVPARDAAPGLDEASLKKRLRDKFDESVRLRMIADVPLGAFLSGGVDSSAVVASMAVQSPQPVKTFSIGFEEAEYNELEYSRQIAKLYKTDHHEILVKPDSIDLVRRLVNHFDEPFGDSSAIPTLIVSEFARRDVKVVLTGDGGDEVFGGYPSFLAAEKLARWNRLPGPLRSAVASLAGVLPYSAYGKNFLHMISLPTAIDRYFEWNYLTSPQMEQLLAPRWIDAANTAYLRKQLQHCLLKNGVDPVTQTMFFEATANLTGDMLVKVDRMSMAASIETRCPMLDHELAELAAGIPHAWKMRGGQGKAFFIETFSDRLPESVWNRPKRGFSVPIAAWFRGPLKSFLRDHITSRRFLDLGFVEPSFLERLLAEHESGRRNNRTMLWNLLMLDLWCQQWQVTAPPARPAVPNLAPSPRHSAGQ